MRLLRTEILRRALVLVIDETQQRRPELSFLYAVLKEELARKDCSLHIVFMSAENEFDAIHEMFGSETAFINVPGRRYEVERYEWSELPAVSDIDENIMKIVATLAKAEMEASNDAILIFVKGKPEIQQLCNILAQVDWTILGFHADMTAEEQAQILDLTPLTKSTVIVATNAAETSLTIPAVKVVICSCRCNASDVGVDGIPCNRAIWCSREQVRQEFSRAGRVSKGKGIAAVPLSSLPATSVAEITIASDLGWLALALAERRLDFNTITWMRGHQPTSHLYEKALKRHCAAGFLEYSGEASSQVPLRPSLVPGRVERVAMVPLRPSLVPGRPMGMSY